MNKFKEWAKGFSGCDGGDLAPEGIWFCGVEWGGNYPSKQELESAISQDVSSFPSHSTFNTEVEIQQFLKHQFSRKLSKILAVINGEEISRHQSFLEASKPFSEGSKSAKFNLFPIACKTEQEWLPHYAEVTGFNSKNEYQNWCRENRFELFRSITKKHNPKLIVCCGTQYENDFKLAFGLEPREIDTFQYSKNNGRVFTSKMFRLKNGTLLFVLPFFGQPLNSDKNIEELGVWIREHLDHKQKKSAA